MHLPGLFTEVPFGVLKPRSLQTAPVLHPNLSFFIYPSQQNDANQPQPILCCYQDTNSKSASLPEIKCCMLYADVQLC